jgi:hypothetical protein
MKFIQKWEIYSIISLKWENNGIRVDCYNLYQKKNQINNNKKWNFCRKLKSWFGTC